MEVNLLSVVEAMVILLQEGPSSEMKDFFPGNGAIRCPLSAISHLGGCLDRRALFCQRSYSLVRIDFIQSLVNKLVQSL